MIEWYWTWTNLTKRYIMESYRIRTKIRSPNLINKGIHHREVLEWWGRGDHRVPFTAARRWVSGKELPQLFDIASNLN